MHFQWLYFILLAAILGSPLEVSARAIRKSLLYGDDAYLLRRLEIPGVAIPKPIVPKPIIPEVSNAGSTAGRTPNLAPDHSSPKPNDNVDKPKDNEPASSNSNAEQKPCKRADSAGCSPPQSPGEQDVLLLTTAEPSFLNLKEAMKPLGNDGKTYSGELPWQPSRDEIATNPGQFETNLKTITRKLWENLPASTNKDANLVAALFVPSKGVWFSSIPHDAGDKLIFDDKASAPAWAARSQEGYTRGFTPVPGDRKLGEMHAEDVTIYLFEKSQNHRTALSPEDARTWRFPEGTRLAVYGKYDSQDQRLGFKPSCTGVKGERWPGCSQLLDRLRIKKIT